ncbi:ComF family protein [Mucilaginibacter aquatilis]|uniref:ComF family protein n=1 Tax=Mucilaginibacter aquatilis TaxID=1517760 RepID=A0A6I4IQV9_9SPHI|nr:phosphoribosyltransferase family protein [Mucilaginibacter aquatilis]MVN92393.1 ComF family protein [Mucilaginibacter aquatilis]
MRSTYLSNFIDLLFPRLCQACKANLLGGEDLICTACLYNLPYTNFHLQTENIVARQFWGKVKLEYAYALLYFEKGGKVQHLMHQFKYNGMQKIGNKLGGIAGTQLVQNKALLTVDFIIPVPLHKSRLRERGYNQSANFAHGLAKALGATVIEQTLVRAVKTSTQTRKSRFARFENMQHVFELRNPALLENKHILLVDDIVTTGSTLESCAHELLKVPSLRLSIATIAYAV